MTDENKEKENTSDSSAAETSRPPYSSSEKPFDSKKMKEDIKKAKEDAIPRMHNNAPGWFYAPGKEPPITKPIPKPSFIEKNKRTIGVGSVLTGIGIVLTIFAIPGVYDAIFPPIPEFYIEVNADTGIMNGNKFKYSYAPEFFTPNGTKNEIFVLTLKNSGNAEAHNFWMDVKSQPDGLWFTFQESFVRDPTHTIGCPQKKSYCTIGLIPKDSSSHVIQYDVQFDHKLIQEIKGELPKLFFIYDYDEGEEQTIQVELKFD